MEARYGSLPAAANCNGGSLTGCSCRKCRIRCQYRGIYRPPYDSARGRGKRDDNGKRRSWTDVLWKKTAMQQEEEDRKGKRKSWTDVFRKKAVMQKETTCGGTQSPEVLLPVVGDEVEVETDAVRAPERASSRRKRWFSKIQIKFRRKQSSSKKEAAQSSTPYAAAAESLAPEEHGAAGLEEAEYPKGYVQIHFPIE
jgi:hypothetical protein